MEVGQYAPWLALVASAWNAGVTGARARAGLGLTPVMEAGLLAAAALAIVGWATWLGGLIADAPGAEPTPIHVETGYRMAATWATWRGVALSLAVMTLAAGALVPAMRGAQGGAAVARQAFRRSIVGAAALAVVAADLFPVPAAPLPAFVQAPSAAIAPLAALLAVALLILAFTGSGAPPRLAAAAWCCASIALGAEQVARAGLGIGPGDPVVFGSASSGLVLWLVTSALIHRRIAARLFGRASASTAGPWPGRLAHAGAVLVAASFAAHVFAARTTVDLPPGRVVAVADAFGREWQLVNQGVSRYDSHGAFVTALAIEATPAGSAGRLVATERREHPALGGGTVASGRRGSAGRAMMRLRILLDVAERDDLARVRITFLPLPILWDAGIVMLLVASGLVMAGRGSRYPA